jgi:hypothetical protein
MKNKIKIFLTIITGVAVGLLSYNFIYRISPRKFIGEKATIVYVNENLSGKHIEKLIDLLEEDLFDFSKEDFRKIKKFIDGIYLISETPILEKEKNIFGVIDTGLWYPVLLLQMNKYFDKVENFYVLKTKYKTKYFGQEEIYLLPYRGQFLFSFQPDMLRNANRRTYLEDKTLTLYLNKESKNDLGILIYDGMLESSLPIKKAYLTGKVKKDKIILNFRQELNKNIFGYSNGKNKERILVEYLDLNHLYFSINDFSNIEELFYKFLYFKGERNLPWKWQGFLGFKATDIIKDELGGEFIFDLKRGDTLISLGEAKKIRQAFKFFGQNNEIKINAKKLRLDENKLVYGESNFEKGTLMPALNPNTFLYLKMDLKDFGGKGIIEMQGEVSEKNCVVQSKMDGEAINSLIKYIKKGVAND